MFQLDLRSRIPIYEQVIEKLKELIIREIVLPDEQLPSVRMLAQQLSVNPNTIQKGYRELEHQGFIYSIPGKGKFVAPQSDAPNKEKVKKMQKDIIKLISEAMYLGMEKEDIMELITIAEKSVKGGDGDDSNS